jgi:transcriptional regulator with XRE-family HTH domain
MKTATRELAARLGQELRRRRRSLGISQEDLSVLAGISIHTLSNLESGKANPSLDVLEPLLDCLGLDLSLHARSSSASEKPSPTEHP